MNRKSCAQLKLEARQLLKGKYGVVVGVMLILSVIMIVVMGTMQFCITFASLGSTFMEASDSYTYNPGSFLYTQIGSIIMSFLMSLLIVVLEYLFIPGYIKLHMNICTGQPYGIGDMFFAFKNHPLKFICLALCMWLVNMVISVPMMLITFAVMFLPVPLIIVLEIVVFIVAYAALMILMLKLSMAIYIMVENPEVGVIECIKESFRIMKGNKRRLFYIGLSFIGVYLLGMLSFGIGFLWAAPYMSVTFTLFYLEIRKGGKEEAVQISQVENLFASEPYDYQNPM